MLSRKGLRRIAAAPANVCKVNQLTASCRPRAGSLRRQGRDRQMQRAAAAHAATAAAPAANVPARVRQTALARSPACHIGRSPRPRTSSAACPATSRQQRRSGSYVYGLACRLQRQHRLRSKTGPKGTMDAGLITPWSRSPVSLHWFARVDAPIHDGRAHSSGVRFRRARSDYKNGFRFLGSLILGWRHYRNP